MKTNEELIDYLVDRNFIRSESVEKAFRAVDRADFVPEKYRERAYIDRPLPIGDDATISAPHMVATNTELLEPNKNSEILEMGSGSGYQLAILAELAAKVTGVEINQELVKQSRKRLSKWKNAEVVQGSSLGVVSGKFDGILYSFGTDTIDKAKQRIKKEGVVVAPINMNGIQKLIKWKEGELTEHARVSFVRDRKNR